MDDVDELIAEFLVESTENLDRLDLEFIELEAAPGSTEVLASIFRTIHTIKGTAGFLGLDRLGALTHAGESLLSRLRDGELSLDEAMTSALLAMVDATRAMLARIEATGSDEGESHAELIVRLEAFLDPHAAPAAAPTGPPEPVTATAADAEAVTTAAADTEPEASTAAAGSTSGTESSIRVDVGLLDRLMNLVGELVLARNQMLQFRVAQSDPAFVQTSQQLDLITTDLQEGVMKTRMQPIGRLWSKMPRVVRDLAVTCGKSVHLEMEGEETELDRTILEAIKDPLTHIVRNAVDHGLESPTDRLAAGKPEHGTIGLRAFHEGGQVVVEISDDGAGLNLDRIRARAAERGLVRADQLDRMADHEVANLVFAPGFSTAEQVTAVSGRGVGMDVVKTNIEKVGGSLDLQSQPGRGTTLVVRIPLTLAIIPAIVVTSGAERYAIAQVNLVELLRLDPELPDGGVEHVAGAPVYRLRGRLLPVLDLREVLCLGDAGQPHTSGDRNLVVLQADDRRFGLIVDGIHDTEEIVVKPLAPQLKHAGTFSGTTIMGDGAIALVLDTTGLAQAGGILQGDRDRRTIDPDDASERRSEGCDVIVCSVGGRRIALPLALVDRLEEFNRLDIERTAGHEVIQYRSGLLTLVDLAATLGAEPTTPDPTSPLHVLVHTAGERTYGFVVDEILDILDSDPAAGQRGAVPAVDYSGVIGRRVTDVLQLDRIIASVDRPGRELQEA